MEAVEQAEEKQTRLTANIVDQKVDDLAAVVKLLGETLGNSEESSGNAKLDAKLNKLMNAVSIIGSYTGNNRALQLAGFTDEELHVITKQDLNR